MANILLLGTGVLGKRMYHFLTDKGEQVTTVSRSAVPWSKQHIAADIGELTINANQYQQVYVVLTAKPREAAAYHQLFVVALAKALQQLHQNCHVLFVSSTSVYSGLTQADYINELCCTQASSETGQQLLAAERQIANSGLSYSVVRAGGLYSEQRQGFFSMLQRRADSGELLDKPLHMIHEQDLCTLCYAAAAAKLPLLIATDGSAYTARDWLLRDTPHRLAKGRYQSVFRDRAFYQLRYASISDWHRQINA